jgi:hypothetical protein
MKRAVPLFLLVLIVGCTKLNEDLTVKLEPGVTEYRSIDPIAREQKVNVSAKSDGGQFDIYFFLAKDKAEVEKDPAKAGAKLLGSKTKVTEATFSGTVPANEQATVSLVSTDGKKAEVKLKLTN